MEKKSIKMDDQKGDKKKKYGLGGKEK